MTEKQSSPSKRTRMGSIYTEYLRELFPQRIVTTFWRYFRNHRVFFEQVFSGDWSGKTRPIPFFLACFSFFFLIWPLHPSYKLNWVEAYNTLSEQEKSEFTFAFGLDSIIALGIDDYEKSRKIECHLREVLEVSPDQEITADDVAKHLGREHDRLSLKFENLSLKSELRSGKLYYVYIYLILPLYLFPVWSIAHWLLKKKHRTRKETIYVYIYTAAPFMGLVLPLLFLVSILGHQFDFLSLSLSVLSIVILILSIRQAIRSFRFTHGVGFWHLVYVHMLSSFILFLPILMFFAVMIVIEWILVSYKA